MALFVRVLGLLAAMVLPGGVLVLGAYFLARAVREAYVAGQRRGMTALAHAFGKVRFEDAWRQARRFALHERFD